MSVRSRLLAVSPVVELVIEYVQRFIGNEEPAAFPVDVDMVRAGTGTIAGVLRNRCRSLCVNRNRRGVVGIDFCGGLCRNSPCLWEPQWEFFHVLSSLVAMRLRPLPSSEALYLALPFFQHVTAQYLLVVAQPQNSYPLLRSLATYSSHDQLSMDCRVSMQSRFTCPMFVSRTSAAVVQPRFRGHTLGCPLCPQVYVMVVADIPPFVDTAERTVKVGNAALGFQMQPHRALAAFEGGFRGIGLAVLVKAVRCCRTHP